LLASFRNSFCAAIFASSAAFASSLFSRYASISAFSYSLSFFALAARMSFRPCDCHLLASFRNNFCSLSSFSFAACACSLFSLYARISAFSRALSDSCCARLISRRPRAFHFSRSLLIARSAFFAFSLAWRRREEEDGNKNSSTDYIHPLMWAPHRSVCGRLLLILHCTRPFRIALALRLQE
jgi:hypothetical protein